MILVQFVNHDTFIILKPVEKRTLGIDAAVNLQDCCHNLDS